MIILGFLVFFSIIYLSSQNSDRFSIVNTNSANLSDYDQLLIYSNKVNMMRCLTICQSAPKCRTVLFSKESATCMVYSITEYFFNDGDGSEIRVFNRFIQGILLSTFSFHSHIVMSIVKLNNGFLASGTFDSSIKIFDPSKNSNTPEFTIQDQAYSGIHSLTVLSNDTMASGCGNGEILIWNITNYSLVTTLSGHSTSVKCLLKLSDQLLASGSNDDSVKIWNKTSRTCIKTLQQNNTHNVFSLALLADGSLASGSLDTTIIIWNITTSSVEKKLLGHTSAVTCLISLKNGNLISTGDSTIRIWNVMSGQTVMILTGQSPFTFRPLILYGENVLISGLSDGSLKVWDLTTGQARMTILGHKGKVMSMVKLDNGSLASGSADYTIKIWNI